MNNVETKRNEIIKAENVCKSYQIGEEVLHVLKGVDFSIEENDFILIMGPSGAGKSTLLHIMGGLDCPNSGKIFVKNRDFYSLGDRKRSRIRNQEVGFVFQFYHLLSELTAFENVLLPWMIGKELAKTKPEDARKKTEELLGIVGLSKRMNHRPSELSGGEQQRVAIARSLINSPGVVLADEPSGNLDQVSGEKIYDLLKEINTTLKTSILVVTHNPELVKHAKKCYFIEDGKLKQ